MNSSKMQSSMFFGALGCLLMVVLLSPVVVAQQIRGALEGTVNDPNGAVVPGAKVTVKNTSTGGQITANSDDRGSFNFQNLEPGRYVVIIEKQGFRGYEAKEVTVKVGSVTPLSVTLAVGEAKETVEVVSTSGEATVDTTRPTVDGVVTPKQIDNLPLNGRNFLDLAQSEPGVQVRDGGDFDPTKNQFVGVSMGGRSGRSTRIQVDGVDITDETVGTTTMNLSNETIQEFQVSRSTLDPSTDLTSSGAINIITRSGSNEIHGAGFGFFRNQNFGADLRLNKTSPTTAKPPFDREQFGGRVGGPIIKNKLFWHIEIERNNQDGQQFTQTPNFPQFTKSFPVPLDEDLGGARLDWKVTDRLHAFYRFNHNFNVGVTGFGGIELAAFANLNNTNSHVIGADYSRGSWTHSLRASYLNFNNFIVDANSAAGTPATLDPAGKPVTVRIRSQLDVGPNLLAPQETFQDDKQVKYDGTRIAGNHTLRFGGSYNRIDEAVFASFFGLAPRLSGTFNSSGIAFAATHGGVTDPLSFPMNQIVLGNGLGAFSERKALGFPNGGTTNHRIGVYFTDSWKAKRNLTLTLGLRYDYDSALADSDLVRTAKLTQFSSALAGKVKNDTNNFAPQGGFAWDVRGNGKTVIRGGAGVFYDSNIINNILFDRVLNLPPGLGNDTPVLVAGSPDLLDPATGACLFRATNFRTTAGQCGVAGGVNLFAQPIRDTIAASQLMQATLQAVTAPLAAKWPPAGVPPLFDQVLTTEGSVIFNQYKRPYGLMFNIGVQREIKPGLVLTIDYLRNHGLHFNQTTDLNRIGAANTLDVGTAKTSISLTNADFGCPANFSAAAINCAIAAGASIGDYANEGLGAGSALGGFAFRGQNPNFRDMGLIQPIGISLYNALTVSLRGRMIRKWGPIKEMTGNVSYALSRFKSTGGDQDFLSGSAFNDAPTKFFGPAGLDRTHQLTFGFLTDLLWGFKLNTTTRVDSPLSQSIFVGCVDCGAAEIFMSDFDGDGIVEDPLPGTNRGSFMRNVKNASALNGLITSFNGTVNSGTLTPAGQALISAGLFTQAQLKSLGATVRNGSPVPLAPSNQVGLDWFANTDVRISRVFSIRERVKIQPILEIFNLFNIGNYDSPGGRLSGTLTGAVGTINGTGPGDRSNRYGLGSGSFAPGIPRSFQIGIRVDF